MASTAGTAIRFHESDVRPMGRTARGVRGIALRRREEAIGMVVVPPGEDEENLDLLAITENGYGKRTTVNEYRRQGRGGKGLITIKCTERNGPLIAIRDVQPDDEIMAITRNGIIIRTGVDGISRQGRNTQGVRIMNLGQGDLVANIAKVASNGEEEVSADGHVTAAGESVGNETAGSDDGASDLTSDAD